MTTVIKKQTAKLTPTSDRQPVKIYLSCPTSVDEVQIKFEHPQRDQSNVTDYTMQVVKELFLKSCVSHATITRVMSTSEQQATIMYRNIKWGTNSSYGVYGKQIVNLCNSMSKQKESQGNTIAAMKKQIDALMDKGHIVSAHVNPYNTLFYNVVDFGGNSLIKGDTGKPCTDSKSRAIIYDNFHNDARVKKVLDKDHAGDAALHVEIPQPLAFDDTKIAAMEKQSPFEFPEVAKLAIERARDSSLKFADYPYIFYRKWK